MEAGIVYDVFVSYRHEPRDQQWVRTVLVPALKAEGFRVCLDEECFSPGAFVLREMERAVLQSRYTLAVLTPAYLESGFTELEDLMAEHLGLKERSRRRIVLMREPCDPGLRIETRLWLNMSDDSRFSEQMARLTRELHKGLREPSGSEMAPDDSAWQYDLFVSFAPEDEAWVKGYLVPKLGLPAGRLITRDDFQPGNPLADEFERAVECSRYTLIVLSLAYMKDQWSQFGQQLANYAAIEEKRGRLLPLILEDCGESLSVRTLVHLECRQESNWDSEIEKLRRLLGRPEREPPPPLPSCPYRTLDMLDREGWPAVGHGFDLQRMVVAPALQRGVYIEPRLLDHLTAEAGKDPAVLPFIWHTLAGLWKVTLKTRLLTLGAYKSLGDEHCSALEKSLADRAEAAWKALSEQQRRVARRILLRLMHSPEDSAPTLRSQPLASLRSYREDPGVFDDTVDYLERQRILIRSGAGEADRECVRLIHASLADRCQTVQAILNEYKEPEQQRRRLEQHVEEWERLGRKGGLLDRRQLRQAEAWLAAGEARVVGYSSALLELVAASQKALHRQNVLRGIAVALLLVALVAAALYLPPHVERTRREVLAAKAVAGAKLALQDKNPEEHRIAVLLSLAAVCQVRTSEARKSLLESVAALSQIVAGHRINRLAFDLRGERLATAGVDGVWIWDARTLERLRHFSLGEGVAARSVAWDRLGRLAAGGEEGTVKIWDVASASDQSWQQLPNLKAAVMAVAFGPREGELLTGCAQGQVQQWNIAASPPRLLGAFPNDPAVVGRMVLSRDGSRLAVVHLNGKLRVFDTARRSLASEMAALPADAFVSGMSFGPKGELRTVIKDSTRIIIREAPGGSRSDFVSPSARDLRSVAFRPPPKSTEVVTVAPEGNIIVWDWASRRELHRFQVDPEPRDAAFSPDGKLLVVAGNSGAVTFYYLDDQELGQQAARLIGNAQLTAERCGKYLGGQRCHEYKTCSSF